MGPHEGGEDAFETSVSYREILDEVVRTGVPNLVGLSGASIVVSLTLLPVLASVTLETVPAVLGGLWTTCLLFGVALVGLFRYAGTVADRGVAVSVVPHLVAAAKSPRVGMELGTTTFAVVLGVLLTGLAPDRFRATAIGIGAFVALYWYLVVALAAPELGAGAPLYPALRAGAVRFARSPVLAALFLGSSVVCGAIAGVTVVTLVFFLPGILGLLATHVAVTIADVGDLNETGTGPGR
jgi:hypothetical protein